MKRSTYIKNSLTPCILFSIITGAVTGVWVFAFKFLVSFIVKASDNIYSYIRQKPLLLPLWLVALSAIAVVVFLILRWAKDCRGGGIPTAVAALRGLTPFKWIRSVFILPLSAMITFFCGVPLGNEGPCVQMGTAIGHGTVNILGKNKKAWRKYIMTGGACAGFSAATGAPVTGILFAVEEAHRRFSPLLFVTASICVVVSQAVMELLGAISGIDSKMFSHISIDYTLPLKFLWIALVVGFVASLCAIFFTKSYRAIGDLLRGKLSKVPFAVKILCVFLITGIVGFASANLVGSGHSLIELLLEGKITWYIILICFAVRAVLVLFANNIGVTGGLFIPTLTFGALIGSLCASAFVSLNILDEKYYVLVVVTGMASFLAASSRTPITALTFAVEALCGLSNILVIGLGVSVAFLVIEAMGIEAFNDTVIEARAKSNNKGKSAQVFDMHLTVTEGAFVAGKEIRDVLWPPTCTVLSIEKSKTAPHGTTTFSVGDIIHVHYKTYYPLITYGELEWLVGVQDGKVTANVHIADDNHQVPEL